MGRPLFDSAFVGSSCTTSQCSARRPSAIRRMSTTIRVGLPPPLKHPRSHTRPRTHHTPHPPSPEPRLAAEDAGLVGDDRPPRLAVPAGRAGPPDRRLGGLRRGAFRARFRRTNRKSKRLHSAYTV